MINNNRDKQIRELVNRVISYWGEIGDRYGKLHDFDTPKLQFYSQLPKKMYDTEDVYELRQSVDDVMLSIHFSCGKLDASLPWEGQIVEDTLTEAYVSYESLYRLIIDCGLDFDKVEILLRFIMRHEMGYAITKHTRLVGKTIADWNSENDRHRLELVTLPKLRKNASYNSRLNWLRQYFELPDEKVANDIVGITDDDIVEYWQQLTEQ